MQRQRSDAFADADHDNVSFGPQDGSLRYALEKPSVWSREYSLLDLAQGGQLLLLAKQGTFSRKVEIFGAQGQSLAVLQHGVFSSANCFDYEGKQYRSLHMNSYAPLSCMCGGSYCSDEALTILSRHYESLLSVQALELYLSRDLHKRQCI